MNEYGNNKSIAGYLFVLPWSLKHIGGVNQVVKNLANEFSKCFTPIVLIADWDCIDPVWEDIDGIKTVRWRIRPYRCNMNLKEKFAYKMWEISFINNFKEFCKVNSIEIINLHYITEVAFTFSRLTRLPDLQLPLILSFHGSDISNIDTKSNKTMNSWRTLLKETYIVTCSQNLANKIENKLETKLNANVVHNGFSKNSFNLIEKTVTTPANNYILTVGKFDVIKGQDILIEAFSALETNLSNYHLVMIGSTGNALPELKRLTRQLEISHRVHFYENVPHCDIGVFYKYATVFVLPSRSEAFPLVLLEAGHFSLPVISSDVGGISEIIVDGDNGFLVPANNAVRLGVVLTNLLTDDNTQHRLGGNLNKTVSLNFTWKAAADKYISIFKNNIKCH